MTYTIKGTQYWKRNGIYCSWTQEGGRKVITREEYLAAIGKNSVETKPAGVKTSEKVVEYDPKSKVEIAYQEIGKNDRIVNKKKVVTYGNLDKVIANMEAKDNFVKILATRNV